MSSIAHPTQDDLDAALEREIETAHQYYLHCVAGGDASDISVAFDAMALLIAQRSPEQVARMEARLPEQWRS